MYDGKYRTAQAIALRERKEDRERNEAEWFQVDANLARLDGQLPRRSGRRRPGANRSSDRAGRSAGAGAVVRA